MTLPSNNVEPAASAMPVRVLGLAVPTWPRRYLKPAVLCFLVVVAYMAAINRAQALPWAIAALLTATLIAGVSWPHWLVKRLSVTRHGPTRAAEGDTITFRVDLRNEGRLPRFMVEIVDRLPFVGMTTGGACRIDTALGVVAYVPGGGYRSFDASIVCEKRGLYRLGPLSMASSFPLGLVEATHKRNDGVQNLTVYPSVFPIIDLPLVGAPSQIHRGAYLLPEGAGAAEFSGLREYARGDNPRHVHWPTTARLNELMVKEFEPLASACIWLALDLAAPSNVGHGKHATLEYAIRIAASIANFSCTNGLLTRVSGHGERSLLLPAATGEHHYQAIADSLAVIEADGDTPYATVLQQIALDCQRGETVIVFLSEPAERSADTLQSVAWLLSRGANVFAVVFDRNSFSSVAPRLHMGDSPGNAAAALAELGARCMSVRRGDDLVQLFNP